MHKCYNTSCPEHDAPDRCDKYVDLNFCGSLKPSIEITEPLTTAPTSALDSQVGGNHYKSYKIQPYEFFLAKQIPHHKAAIMRRILRYDHETGKGLEDLQKIKHEVELIIELERWT